MTDPSQYVRERHNDGKRDVRWPDAPEPLRCRSTTITRTSRSPTAMSR